MAPPVEVRDTRRMPRATRNQPAGCTLHVVRRGHNRSACFFADDDRALYLTMLQRYAQQTRTFIHAYVLMSNHVHLLVTTGESDGASRFMHFVGLNYSRAVNRKRDRTGTLWENRLHASTVQSAAYVLACYRYIELNPVRAGMVADPADYRWSSNAANTGVDRAAWIQRHQAFEALGATDELAGIRYRSLFDEPLEATIVANLRTIGEPPGTRIEPGSGGQADANWSSASRA